MKPVGERRVQVTGALRSRSTGAGAAPSQTAPFQSRRFTLEQYWMRGSYEGSLFAPNDERSFAWRGDFIRERFPMLPQDRFGRPIEPDPLWSIVAQFNGTPQSALQRRLKLDASTLEQVLQIGEQQDLLYRLPYWKLPDQPAEQAPLVYLSDSGLLHRLLDERLPDSLAEPIRGKSYESFAISALVSVAGPGVMARVWARGQDEIDLVLEWTGSTECWAIEITRSKTKKLSPGFHRGLEEIGASRAVVVQGNSGLDGGRDGIERLQLIDLLQEVSDR